MIVVEGPDGCGKSNLVQRLAEDLNLPVAERVVAADTTPMVDINTWIQMNLDDGWQEVLFDRHRLISEPIYGSVLRERSQLMDVKLETVQTWYYHWQLIDPIIVICLPPFETAVRNLAEEQNNHRLFLQNSQAFRSIYSLYWSYLSSHHQWHWDYTTDDADNDYKLLMNLIRVKIKQRRPR